MNIFDLPDDILTLIFSHLSVSDIISFSLTCKDLYSTVSNLDFVSTIIPISSFDFINYFPFFNNKINIEKYKYWIKIQNLETLNMIKIIKLSPITYKFVSIYLYLSTINDFYNYQ